MTDVLIRRRNLDPDTQDHVKTCRESPRRRQRIDVNPLQAKEDQREPENHQK